MTDTLLTPTRPVVEAARSAPCLHCHPPATPSSFYDRRRPLLAGLGLAFVLLAAAAALAGGWLALRWDLPIARFAIAHRSDTLDTFFRSASRLGSTVVVLGLSAVLVLVTWSRCRAVALAIAVAALTRPLIEFVLKDAVDRPRPSLSRLVVGTGPSFPSGHVMAAVALYGLLPLVVGLFTRNRVVWWASAAVSGVLIVTIAASRVYLGVHWFSDVVGSMLLGSFFLLAVEAIHRSLHRSMPHEHSCPP
ncbi:MAG TPA: phosphatase PAP2 family protein [Acidimicrobiia bacterium]|nr:phosphatase PAP2 family protein [Acidimicrobiia bacterium]